MYSHGSRADGDLHQSESPGDPAVPPAGARWLRIGIGHDDTGFRIDLTRPAAAVDARSTPVSAEPGEWLLENMARHIVARRG